MPALPLRIRDRAVRVMPRCPAADVTETSPRYSLKTKPGCGGLYIIITSMIILVIDKNGVVAVKTECQPPISANFDRPVPGKITMKLMEPPSGSIHIFRSGGTIKSKQLNAQFLSMLWLNSCLRSCLKELFYPTMSKALYHVCIV